MRYLSRGCTLRLFPFYESNAVMMFSYELACKTADFVEKIGFDNHSQTDVSVTNITSPVKSRHFTQLRHAIHQQAP